MPSPRLPVPSNCILAPLALSRHLGHHTGKEGTETFPLPGILSLLDFSTGNVLCQGYLVTLSVQPTCVSQGKLQRCTRAALSLLKHLVWLAGWASQYWGQHRDRLALLSGNLVSWSARAVLEHTFPSLISFSGTSNVPQPAVKAAGFLLPAKLTCGGTAHTPRKQHSQPLQGPWSAVRAQTAACVCSAGKQQAHKMRFFQLFNLTVSWYYSGNYTSVSLCKLFLLSLVFPLAKN